jgi:hypothetical protein
MGTVYRKTFTKSLPPGAEIIVRKGERFARWKDAKGKRRITPMTTGRDGAERIIVTAATFTAKYRDGSGIVREASTGCRDEVAARSLLAGMERRAQLVKGKVITSAEDAISDHQTTPLAIHFAAYTAHRTAKKQHGNFQGYIDSFATRESFENLLRLRKNLIRRFEYLSKVTSFHFLCKIGMPVIKPDVAIRRVFFRLGLVDSNDETENAVCGVVREGEAFVRATGNPHCYVDIVFAHFGQMATPEINLDRGICLQEKPQCDLCGVSPLCRYFSNRV